jgi:outer membrane protein assembly factor BamB
MKTTLRAGFIIVLLLLAGDNIIYAINPPDIYQSSSENISENSMCWPMFGYNAQNTRRSPYSTADNPGGERWRFCTDQPLHFSTPVIDNNGTIYFPDHFSEFYAVYPNSTLKWMKKLDNNGGVFQPALGSDGTIYVGTFHHFYALYPNGTTKWTLPITDNFRGNPVIGSDGTIYVGTTDTLFAVNPNGTIQWNYTLGRDVVGISLDHLGNIYITSLSDLFSLDPNGTFRWFFDTGWLIDAPTINDDGTIYITDGDAMYALDQEGNIIWNVDSPFGAAPSIAPDGTLIATSFQSSKIIAVNSSNGHLLWTYDIGRNFNVMSAASIDCDGTIYFAACGGGIYLYAMTPTGTFKWRTRLTCDYTYRIAYVDAPPSIGKDGTIFVTTWFSGDDDWGYVHAIGGGKILEIENGYLHLFGKKIIKTLQQKTIIIGAFTLKMKFFHPENLMKVKVLIDNITVCTLENPPFEYRFTTRLVGAYQLEVRGYYNDGAISEELMTVLFFIKGIK